MVFDYPETDEMMGISIIETDHWDDPFDWVGEEIPEDIAREYKESLELHDHSYTGPDY